MLALRPNRLWTKSSRRSNGSSRRMSSRKDAASCTTCSAGPLGRDPYPLDPKRSAKRGTVRRLTPVGDCSPEPVPREPQPEPPRPQDAGSKPVPPAGETPRRRAVTLMSDCSTHGAAAAAFRPSLAAQSSARSGRADELPMGLQAIAPLRTSCASCCGRCCRAGSIRSCTGDPRTAVKAADSPRRSATRA